MKRDLVDWWLDHVVFAGFEWAQGRGRISRGIAVVTGPLWTLLTMLVGFLPILVCSPAKRAYDDLGSSS